MSLRPTAPGGNPRGSHPLARCLWKRGAGVWAACDVRCCVVDTQCARGPPTQACAAAWAVADSARLSPPAGRGTERRRGEASPRDPARNGRPRPLCSRGDARSLSPRKLPPGTASLGTLTLPVVRPGDSCGRSGDDTCSSTIAARPSHGSRASGRRFPPRRPGNGERAAAQRRHGSPSPGRRVRLRNREGPRIGRDELAFAPTGIPPSNPLTRPGAGRIRLSLPIRTVACRSDVGTLATLVPKSGAPVFTPQRRKKPPGLSPETQNRDIS